MPSEITVQGYPGCENNTADTHHGWWGSARLAGWMYNQVSTYNINQRIVLIAYTYYVQSWRGTSCETATEMPVVWLQLFAVVSEQDSRRSECPKGGPACGWGSGMLVVGAVHGG